MKAILSGWIGTSFSVTEAHVQTVYAQVNACFEQAEDSGGDEAATAADHEQLRELVRFEENTQSENLLDSSSVSMGEQNVNERRGGHTDLQLAFETDAEIQDILDSLPLPLRGLMIDIAAQATFSSAHAGFNNSLNVIYYFVRFDRAHF